MARLSKLRHGNLIVSKFSIGTLMVLTAASKVCRVENFSFLQHHNITRARKSPAELQMLLKISHICGIIRKSEVISC